MLTLAVIQALLGYTNETQWLRYARKNLLAMFATLPLQSGYNKRLRKLAATMTWLIAELGCQTSVGEDRVWVVDSTPVECARSRETVKRSELAGWAEYGFAPRTPGSSGAYACTWCAPCTACPWGER